MSETTAISQEENAEGPPSDKEDLSSDGTEISDWLRVLFGLTLIWFCLFLLAKAEDRSMQPSPVEMTEPVPSRVSIIAIDGDRIASE